MVFSTAPNIALAQDGHRYVLKGPDPAIVFAEVACYLLAAEAGIPVPEWGICHLAAAATMHFASRYKNWRSVEPLIGAGKASNPGLVADVVPFDLWVHNVDRNVQNFVAEFEQGARTATLYAIDFEKSRAFRGTSALQLPMIDAKNCWPRDALLPLVRKSPVPIAMARKIQRTMTLDRIRGLLEPVLLQVPAPQGFKLDLICNYLASRTSELEGLTKEAWNG